jgi:adenylosuccinate lyase
MAELGLRPAAISTQIVPRDRHADLFTTLALVGCAVERLAVELRHLARSEVGEIQEFFGERQKGSSAMPHKRNPWRLETLTGLARLVRGYAASALENTVLWHERDISNSSVERVIGPDATGLIHFMLHRLASLVESLQVFPQRMRANLDASRGLVYSGSVLLALARRGVSRQDAYRHVQRHAMATWDEGGYLYDRLTADPDLTRVLPAGELAACFDLETQLRNIEIIFDRVLD